MKKTLIAFWMIANFAFAEAPPVKTGAEGHGGDPLYNYYVRARNFAADEMLTQIDVSWLRDEKGTSEEYKFLKSKKTELIEDLKKSPIVLRESNPNGKCGQTGNTAKATIYLSRKHCPELDKNFQELAEMLIGEAVHHFDQGDEFAASFAVAIGDAFKKGPPIEGRWYDSSAEYDIEFLIEKKHKDFEIQFPDLWRQTGDYGQESGTKALITKLNPRTGTFELKGDFVSRNCRTTLSAEGKISRNSQQNQVIELKVSIANVSCYRGRNSFNLVLRRGKFVPSDPTKAFPWDYIYEDKISISYEIPEPVNQQFPWNFFISEEKGK